MVFHVLALALAASTPPPAAAVVVGRFISDFSSQNAGAIESYVRKDASVTMPFAPGGPQSLTGSAAAIAYFRTVFAKYQAIHMSGVSITPAADSETVLVEATAEFEARGGDRHKIGYVWVVKVIDGKIVSSRNYAWPLNETIAP